MKCIIMAGGKGTRMWPISRQNKPKQFQAFTSDKTMFQETYLRMRKRFAIADIYVSTNDEYVPEVEREIIELPKQNIISEPAVRGTASSFALAVARVAAENESEIMAMFPADHFVKHSDILLAAIERGEKFLSEHPKHIVTFGIVPKYPETGYGYIESKKKTFENFHGIFPVERFVEKPDAMTAQKYIDAKTFYWNSGMYMFRADAMQEKFRKYIPDTYRRLERIKKAVGTGVYAAVLEEEYPQMDKINIEYAVVENDVEVAVIPLDDMGWSDVGSWASLKDALSENSLEHFVRGEHVDFNSENLLVYGSKKLITTIGVKDLIIVDSEDAILICDRNKAQMVSDVVKKLEASNKVKLL